MARSDLIPKLLQGVFLTALLFIISAIDIKKRIIPDTLCALVALTGLICFEPINLLGVFCAVPFYIAAMIWGGTGGGDIKLMAAAGIVLGFWDGIYAMIVGLSAMLIFYLSLKIYTKTQGGKRPKMTMSSTAFPLAPFLTVGILTVYYLNIIGGLYIWLF